MVSGSLISSPPGATGVGQGAQRLLREPQVAKLAERNHPAFGKIGDEVEERFFAATATDVPAVAARSSPLSCQT